MTDKSFGDHMNRNIVKNPLLSTAVTGLSIEDLTHNAVLVPVSLSQEAITRPDRFGTQQRNLGHTEHAMSNFPSGDSNSNTIHPPSNTNPFQLTQHNTKIEKPNEKLCATQSKASVKSEDDFDVNEYFARLQGTRYVSAPLNSQIQDKNANLEATEENLEEINLNEPEKFTEQSITADIAQNFSQLPTVLPQMASAVFSSFSNMLSLKSREQTPDEVKTPEHHEVQFQREDAATVALMGVTDYAAKEVAPPPKEPPVTGTGNFRITSKKKYAQIPGLSSHDPPQSYNPTNQNPPPYFVPGPTGQFGYTQSDIDSPRQHPQYFTPSPVAQTQIPAIPNASQNTYLAPNTAAIKDPQDGSSTESSQPALFTPAQTSFDIPQTNEHGVDLFKDNRQQTYSFPNPDTAQHTPVANMNVAIEDLKVDQSLKQDTYSFVKIPSEKNANDTPITVFTPELKTESMQSQPEENYCQNVQNLIAMPTPQPNASIIPPPPMFSNLPRRDSQGTGKAFLPPSVARRISANQPIIKSQPSQTVASFSGNIFVPTITEATDALSQTSDTAQPSINPPSAFASFNTAAAMTSITPPSLFTPQSQAVSTTSQSSFNIPTMASFPPQALFTPASSVPKSNSIPSVPIASSLAYASPESAPSNIAPPPTFGSQSFLPPNASSMSSNQSQPLASPPTFTSNLPKAQDSSVLPPSTFFTPSAMPEAKDLQQQSNITHFYDPPNTGTEPSKPIPEPPKAAGNLSYRMAKKRPQYYSGPIEGVGAISNNVKPVIAPVESNTFQGALFTPTKIPETVEQTLQPNIDQSSAPFDICRPAEITTYAPFGSSDQDNIRPEFNTAFDLSRETTEHLERPRQETKGFGIIGSLKSKLSSLDINKIQSTVTTFFDPAYNDTNKTKTDMQVNVPYGQYPQYGENQSSNFEIFVPNVEYSSQYQPYSPQHQTPYQTDQNQYSVSQDLHNYYENQDQTIPMSSYYSNLTSNQDSYNASSAQTNVMKSIPSSYAQELPANATELNVPYDGNTDTRGAHFVAPTTYTQDVDKHSQILDTNYSQIVTDSVGEKMAKQPIIQDFSQPPSYFSVVQSTTKDEENKSQLSDNITTVSKPVQHDLVCDKSFFDMTSSLASNSAAMFGVTDNCLTQSIKPQINQVSSESTVKSFFDTPDKSIELIKSEVTGISHEPSELFVPNVTQVDNTTAVTKTEETQKNTNINEVTTPSSQVINSATDLITKSFFEITPSLLCDHSNTSKFDLSTKLPGTDMTQNLFEFGSHFTGKSNFGVLPSAKPEVFKTQIADSQSAQVKDQQITAEPQKMDTFGFEHITKSNENPSDFFSTLSGVGGNQKSNDKVFSSFVFNQDNKTEIADSENQEKDVYREKVPDFNVSAPLFGLSTMLADKTKELSDIESETQDLPKDIDTIFNRNSNIGFFDYTGSSVINPIIDEKQLDDENDLNICETCREVNKPEGIEKDDLTLQLIENITSPIQLSNPVEVPLTESNTPIAIGVDFDSSQCAEISHITEETIETIQVQSATELLDDDKLNNAVIRSYGWNTEDNTMASNVMLDHEYGLQINPNSIGIYGNTLYENIPRNASDEIKAELKVTQEETSYNFILPRQMSIPTAPPEEDSKSDETGGIDVHLIEQDAKKDFPYFDEFVIEPSTETDDDKIEFIEREKSDEDFPVMESFTNRVDKFKKGETADSLGIRKKSPTTCLSKPMASYFDTGNFAVDTHFKNTEEASSSLDNFNVSPITYMRVPPGFEEEYQRRMSGVASDVLQEGSKTENEPFIPDTSTQTRLTYSPTFTTAQRIPDLDTGFAITPRMTEQVQETPKTEIKSDINTCNTSDKVIQPIASPETFENSQVFRQTCGVRTEDTLTEFEKKMIEDGLIGLIGNEPVIGLDKFLESKKSAMPSASSIFGFKEEVVLPAAQKPITQSPAKPTNEVTPQQSQVSVLPDPINFLSHNEPISTQVDNSSSNRLASYFTSPPKTEQSKSFFELSQGQDHYRQRFPHPGLTRKKSQEETKPDKKYKTFYELSQNDNNYLDRPSIRDLSPDQYSASINLVQELASFQNPDFSPEKVVRKINYFTVEYDNDNLNLTNELNKGEPELVKKDDIKNGCDLEPETDIRDDKKAILIVQKCKYCCNLNDGYVNKLDCIHCEDIVDKEFKVKKSMDDNSEAKKDIMENRSDSEDRNHSVTVTFDNYSPQEESNEGVAILTENRSASEYAPVKHHWFFRVDVEGKSTWRGFSVIDNKALEEAFHSPDLNDTTVVATDGGRFDVNVVGRLRVAVYWADKPSNVRRCSWFYKGNMDARYVPYTEAVAEKLEEEYRHGVTTGEWHRRLVLPNNELVVLHGPAVMVHFLQNNTSDPFGSPPQSTMRPRVVRRGCDESEIEDVEPSSIDHLLLLCHGVGSACDMRFRAVEEVVDDFRATSLQLLQSHYRNSYDTGVVGRVEVLPISWHATLHSGETGVDRRLARITLDSIPRLRSFTNDTVLDVLFYTSPVYSQTIIDTVCKELNRIHSLFCARNPDFSGGVSLGGHSLGSVILYDLLCHQAPSRPIEPTNAQWSEKTFVQGAPGTGQPAVHYPRLEFAPVALYALGSPIAIFECIRGVESLGPDFALPTCQNFFNIFHPYDPIAYRIEPLISDQLRNLKPQLIPHHKGRKRMHLELKDTMARVGADIKQKLIESIKSTWSNMWKSQPPPTDRQLEKVVEEEIEKEQLSEDIKEDPNQNINSDLATPELLGKLNGGRRVDYVLQEAPFEMINEYIFAMSSHVCYWESEDTMLLMLREIYDAMGVRPDCTVPQQSMSVHRVRQPRADETIVLNATDNPSTSRGSS